MVFARAQPEICPTYRKMFIECVIENAPCISNGTCKTFKEALTEQNFPFEVCSDVRMQLFECRRSYVDRRFRLKGTKDIDDLTAMRK